VSAARRSPDQLEAKSALGVLSYALAFYHLNAPTAGESKCEFGYALVWFQLQ
jgi:hypothetical protein